MSRKELVEARLRRGWSQEDLAAKIEVRRSTVSEWERGVKAPYPTHVKRLCEVFGMTPEELGLHDNHITNDMMVSGKYIDDIIEQCTAGIEICRQLGNEQISSDNLQSAQTILASYVPMLQSISCIERTTPLLMQIYQIQHNNAYHLETISQALFYANEAVRYARKANDTTILTTTLHELASVYEWPLPGWSPRQRHSKSLELAEEMIHIQETKSNVPHRVQALNYIRHAKFQALSGLKQETYTSIGKAKDAQDHMIIDSTFNPTEIVNLLRQTAIAYSYLGEQAKAVDTFLQTLTINDDQIKPAIPAWPNKPEETPLSISNYIHISLLSETLYSMLRLLPPKKDKDLSVKLWKAALAKALELKSTTYYNEAQSLLTTMECIWPDDKEVADLCDLLVPW
jgi:transcriptional regulator with XRE-family HTH domain